MHPTEERPQVISVLTYKRGVMTGIKSVTVENGDIPSVTTTDVLLKVEYCGICGTDLAYYSGLRKRTFPYYPGHEYSAIVSEAGSGVRNVKVGDRVTVNPNFICGNCDFCRRGKPNLCVMRDRKFYSNGGLSELLTIHHSALHMLPDDLDLRSASLAEPLACVLTAISKLAEILQYCDSLLILGGGAIGLLCLEVLRKMRPSLPIVLSEPLKHRRELALKLGASIAIGTDPLEMENAFTSINKLPDLVLECAGDIEAVYTAIKMVRTGGTVLLIGRSGTEKIIELVPEVISSQGLQVIGSVRLTPENMAHAIQMLAKQEIVPHHYLNAVYELDDLADAFEFASAGHGIKTVVHSGKAY